MEGTSICGKLYDNKILVYVFLKKISSTKKQLQITVMSGVLTVHSADLEENRLINASIDLNKYKTFYKELESKPVGWDIYSITSENFDSVVNCIFDDILNYIVKKQSTLIDYHSCLEFLKYTRVDLLKHADLMMNNSGLLIEINDHDMFQEALDSMLSDLLSSFDGDENDPVYIEYASKYKKIFMDEIIVPRDSVFNNPENLENYHQKMRQRIAQNILRFKKYGLI